MIAVWTEDDSGLMCEELKGRGTLNLEFYIQPNCPSNLRANESIFKHVGTQEFGHVKSQ